MSDRTYIYGDSNGATYTDRLEDEAEGLSAEKVHWDPRVEVSAVAHVVQIGVVPPSAEQSTNDRGHWNPDDGQFLSLSRDGVNRLIRSLREARDEAYGRDE